jgi:signal transduction histidine kinase
MVVAMDTNGAPSDDVLAPLMRVATTVSAAPMAVVALGRGDQQRIRGQLGVPEDVDRRRDDFLARFCRQVADLQRPLLVPRARGGDADGPIVAYLGVPLVAADGETLGALCVLDGRPRAWRAEQVAALVDLAALAARLAGDDALAAGSPRDREVERLEGVLLMAIAHDLAQPVQVVRGHAQVLRRRLERGTALDRAAVLAALERIEASADRIAAEIETMVEVGQAEPGRRPTLARRLTDLVELARRAVAERQGASTEHTLTLATAEPDLIGLVDAAGVRRALENLLGNAIKYSPDGGAVVVTVAREEGPAGPVAVVAVRDQGMGVPAADVPRLAERFFRAGNAVGRFPGTGIGLAAARQTAVAHGGRLSVDSAEGVGTTVSLWLPLAPADEPARSGAPARQPRLGALRPTEPQRR